MTRSPLSDLDMRERLARRAIGDREGAPVPPTYSARAGGTTLHRDKPLGILGRLVRWWRGGR